MIGDARPTQPDVPEDQKWKVAILNDVEQFVRLTEHNFRNLFAEATKKQPLPENADFTLNTFCDGLVGVAAHLVCNFVGSSPGAEEAMAKAVRTKFAQFRAESLRRKIMASRAPNPN